MTPRLWIYAFGMTLASATLGASTWGNLARADGPPFSLPLACAVGKDCFVQNYVDLAPGEEAKDFRCNTLTYNGHDGTDIRLRDYPQMRQGIAVLAAAAGRVRNTRDGMADVTKETLNPSAITGRYCGNAVILEHDDGWTTTYCHMRQGSVAVKKDDMVTRGQKLGLIGNSGMAEFPHVHFEIQKNRVPLDPFTGKPLESGCNAADTLPNIPLETSLWTKKAAAEMPYVRTGILISGFADRVPTPPEIRNGDFAAIKFTRTSPALVFWVELFGKVMGDTENLLLVSPSGKALVANSKKAIKNEASSSLYFGIKAPPGGWEQGRYKASYILTRSVNGQAPQPVVQVEKYITIN
ncbi:MAG: M23 family metallopeptidase [Alphaproteobacteria bacterium]